ncbi:hypothetical protein [Niabella beijingensis]|uniref:hypothetical protein n=1 Tax=Niabella beijingensis TaxID=2872700 RepID=UPI001CBFC86D|nr:hypothetical protein [Niabella beijingensis]MBZ4192607.1 hypothetical protein [Niabella beijingensis]
MSMHEIEDLIEDTTYLTDRASGYDLNTRRDILYNLYELMALFDTSYTHFRVIGILLKYRFVYQIPLANYPQLGITDAQLPSAGESGWVHDGDTTIGYAVNTNGDVQLYGDAGDVLWARLCSLQLLPEADRQMPQKMSAVKLATTIMLEAEEQQDLTLLGKWYNFFTNAVFNKDFGETEGVPATFNRLLTDDDYTRLRNIALRNQLNKQKTGHNQDNYLSFPGLKYQLDLAAGIEETYIVRYLLELSKSTGQLQALYEKDKKALEKRPEKIGLIHKMIDARLGPANWNYVQIEKGKTWSWYKDLEDRKYGGPGHRIFIQIDLDAAERALFCKQAIQHSLILQWQEKRPTLAPADWHFYYDINNWLPDDFITGNKHLNRFGVWKFDVMQSEKILLRHLENLLAGLQLLGNDYFDFVLTEFPEKFSKQDPQKIVHLLEEGEDGIGIIPKHILFDSKITTLTAFAKIYSEQGDLKKTESMMTQIKKISETERISSLQKDAAINPVLEYWQNARQVVFPPVWHYYLMQALRRKA